LNMYARLLMTGSRRSLAPGTNRSRQNPYAEGC
jgi:hypothetical protein